MIIRKYKPLDCKYLAELFYNTVHTVNAKDYTEEQLNVWATGTVDLERWNQSFLEHNTVVAVENEEIIGFGDMADTGYLDRLYVHQEWQKQGIATAICNELENSVNAAIISTHASITARPFFEKRGYKVVKEQSVERGGIFLTNYVMEKYIRYTVRKIEKKDNKAVENIIRTCLIEFGANHEGTAWADPDLGRFSEIYNTEGNQYWVAEDTEGKIVGGVGIGSLEGAEDICELQKMYCLNEARGTGVAYQLMNTALTYAKKYYKKCYLETLENMTVAQKFYEKYGFKRIYEPLVKTEHFACEVRYIKEV